MANYASPGIFISERELSTSLTQSLQNIGIITLAASIGPVDTVTYINSENQLLSVFGTPNENNFEEWYAAKEFIAYGGIVGIIRPSNTSGTSTNTNFPGTGANALQLLTNANVGVGAASTTLLIRNQTEYEQAASYNYIFAAKTPSEIYNNLAVYVIDKGADQILEVANVSGFAVGDLVAIGYTKVVGGLSQTDGSAVITGTIGSFTNVTVGSTVTGTGIPAAATVLSIGTTGSGGQEFSTLTISDNATSTIAGTASLTFSNYNTDSVGNPVYAYIYSIDTQDSRLFVTLNNPIYAFSTLNNTIYDATTLTSIITATVDPTTPYSTLTYDGVNLWQSIVQTPRTTEYTASRGGLFDEMHIIVADYTGKITGTPGTILETFFNVSKANDTLNANGISNFYRDVLAARSNYIYAGNSFIQSNNNTVAPELIAGTPQVTATIGSSSLNGIFRLFRNSTTGLYNQNIAYTPNSDVNTFNNGSSTLGFWGGGKDYDFVNNSTAIQNALINAYEIVADVVSFNEFDFLLSGKQNLSKASRLISIANRRKDLMVALGPSSDLVIGEVGGTLLSSRAIANNITNYFAQLPPSSYVVAVDNYKYIYDTYNNKYRWVSTANDVAGLIIRAKINDAFYQSPAGVNRGQLINTIKLAYNSKQVDRDLLYTNSINSVITQPGYGFVLWGDKTYTKVSSVFDRINKRTLFLALEAAANRYAISLAMFEFNNDINRSIYKAAMNSIMQPLQSLGGIIEYAIICDSTNNTEVELNNQVFRADFFIKPVNATNAVFLNFIGTRANVNFNEIIRG